MDRHEYAIIMAGGIGSRFWPASRNNYPKQFLDILNTGKTLIQWTYDRFRKFIPAENIYIVTNKLYVDIVKEQLEGLPEENIVAEPSRRNTAPCIAYISYKIFNKDPEARMICSPADHLILDQEVFSKVCETGLDFVRDESALLTLGIHPNRPDTGYGYIQFKTPSLKKGIHVVKTFTEKPNEEMATSFIESGDFLWNAGIFLWHVKAIINAFKKYQPEMSELFEQIVDTLNTDEEEESVEIAYSQCINISIDFAIMEKADNVYVIPANFGWSDLGTWNSAYENMEKDYFGNAVIGDHVRVIDASQCVVKAQDGKLVVLQGLNNYIIVDTSDVLLICKKDKEQEIKNYVSEIKRNKGEKFL